MKLLLNLRDVKNSLPKLSQKLGHMVRTNSEALLGSVARKSMLIIRKAWLFPPSTIMMR